jgi:hypothetical protein
LFKTKSTPLCGRFDPDQAERLNDPIKRPEKPETSECRDERRLDFARRSSTTFVRG